MNPSTAQCILKKLPLAEATMKVWRWILDPQHTAECFEKDRGRCHKRVGTFASTVHLTADTLRNYQGNTRRCFEDAIAGGTLTASVRTAKHRARTE